MKKTNQYKAGEGPAAWQIFRTLIQSRLIAEDARLAYENGEIELTEYQAAVRRMHNHSWTKFRRTNKVDPPEFMRKECDYKDIEYEAEYNVGDLSAEKMEKMLEKYALLHEELDFMGKMKALREDEGFGVSREE